ncbi:histidine kinase [Nocardioides sp. HM23]|uniref:histidine kinase n=1 Tax=Nocardioides bizhenqiangii TaxID=3095076 RepID=A0ABZ0ZPE2_9ACTN|nr:MULTISPECIES: histidine kinase [unclassified Nocardioides]MDZ5619887.1 histidine kinase [Nocardioides sp. HM23]WQQ26107.1 histidine kinase [Nocardioides sp. HM61]
MEATTLETGVPGWAHATTTVVVMLGLAWRRQYPLFAVVLALAGIIAGGRPDTPFVLFAAMVVASYTVGLVERGRRALAGLLIAVLPPFAGLLLDGSDPADLVAVAVLYGGAWVVGSLVREQIQRADGYAVEVAAIQGADAERRAQAAAEERVRIARELHDVISHSISVITVQSQAVRRRLPPEQRREIEDLKAIETTARQAMTELRRLFGVLRSPEDRPPLAPQPGLDQLPRLVERTTSAGLPVEVDVEGSPFNLPPGLDLTVYRIIQESLTNALKHAGPATARVRLCYSPAGLQIRVQDDGGGQRGQREGAPSEGHGLVGMQERVAMYGGTLTAGDTVEGGFAVTASIPVGAEATGP